MADLTGQTLGQYTIGELIGWGGMAQVYRAHQPSMDRDVAIKVMASELTSNPEFVARFEREARVIARLQHPHILPVIDFGRSGPHVYLVMRLIAGGVLSERMIKTPLTIQQTERFLSQIASALEYAHRNSVIHRDLKPTNVLLDEQDNVYLTDFGIAKMLAGSTSNYSLTATGRVMGTPAYMAPEQWRSDPVDARTDIYALGVILYEMLIGALPFNSETPYGMMYKHFDTPPPAPRAVNPNLPDALEQVVLHALAKEAGNRYPSAQVMADEFSMAVRTLPPDVLSQPLPRASIEQIERATPPSQRQQASATPLAPAAPATAQSGYYAPAFGSDATHANQGGAPTLARGAGRKRGGIMIAGIVLLLITVAAIIGILLLTSGGDDGDGDNAVAGDVVTPTATDTQSAIVVFTTPQSSDTPVATETAAAIAAEPSHTPTDPPSETPPPTATATLTPTATATATETLIPSETPDLDATASQLVAERLTQTAESWTDTPTPDIEASVIAAMTGTAEMWTATPTATYTITPSPTVRNTLPPPPTSTPIPSRTPRPTLAPTLTPRPTLPPTWTPYPTATASCNTLPSRMETGEGGRTTLFPDEMTHIRRYPGTSQLIVHAIPPGLTFDVLGGPECESGILWWYVEGYDASGRWSGWIGEGRSGEYWIEPYETGGLECAGSLPPRLIPGDTGRVKLYPASPNRVRSAPTTSQNNTLGYIQPGEDFDVISGPVCDEENKWRWWYVQKGSLSGWTAEGEPGTYWLEPAP